MINLRVAPLNLGPSSGAGTQLTPFPTGRIVSRDFPGNKLPGYFHPVPPGQKHLAFASHVSQPHLRLSASICGSSCLHFAALREILFAFIRVHSRLPLREIWFLMTRYERG